MTPEAAKKVSVLTGAHAGHLRPATQVIVMVIVIEMVVVVVVVVVVLVVLPGAGIYRPTQRAEKGQMFSAQISRGDKE